MVKTEVPHTKAEICTTYPTALAPKCWALDQENISSPLLGMLSRLEPRQVTPLAMGLAHSKHSINADYQYVVLPCVQELLTE